MNRILLFSFSIVFINSCASFSEVGNTTYSFKPPNVKGTFLKFEIKNYKNRKNFEPNWVFYSTNLYMFTTDWIDPDPPFLVPKNSGYYHTINPSETYYVNKNDSLYKNRIRQILGGDRRDNFLYDCEYWMPIPAGKNKFRFHVLDYEEQRKEVIWKEFDLPENTSIRLKIEPIMVQEEKESITSKAVSANEKYISERRGFQFIFQLEPNQIGEKEPQCSPDK